MRGLVRSLRRRLILRAMRTPYFHLDGYMKRWWLFGGSYRDDKRTPSQRGWRGSRLDAWIGRWVCARIHYTLRSDGDRHLHDHPCASVSIVLAGGYWEVTPAKQGQHPVMDEIRTRRRWRGPGAIVFRRATSRHRLIVDPQRRPWSLFILGPRCNEWGFYTANGKVPWRIYVGLDAREEGPIHE